MCKAASFVVVRGGKAYYHPTQDSHSEIIRHHNLHEGTDNLVPVELTPPKDGNLLTPLDKWVFGTDLDAHHIPEWYFASEAERLCRLELPNWYKKLDGVRLDEAYNPVNPLKITAKKLTQKHKKALEMWQSVGQSVRQSVEQSVWESLGQSVGESVEQSVGQSVRQSVGQSLWQSVGQSLWQSVEQSVGQSLWQSVRESVWGYVGGLFPNITTWKHAEKLGPMPWAPLRKLWLDGYVPTFDGTTWRLHTGEKAEIVYEWKPGKAVKA